MAEREAKIVVRKDYRTGGGEVSVVDPKTGRESRTGLTARDGADQDKIVRQIKETMERGGNRVSYREL
jgi:hypothetical protein